MRAHSAWDFYFDRAEREALLERLRLRGYCAVKEVCYRNRNGWPIRLFASHGLAGVADGQPELILTTAIEVTEQSNPRTVSPEPSASTAEEPGIERDRVEEVSQKVAHLLQHAAQMLQGDNLLTMGKAEIRGVLLVLEEIKMLISELEILRLPRK